jgi:glucose/arabinose dehydrogenase
LKYVILCVVLIFIGAAGYEYKRDYIKSVLFFVQTKKANLQNTSPTVESGAVSQIQTVNYPLKLDTFDLDKTPFAPGAGSLGVLCGKIVALDRSGTFFFLEENTLNAFAKIDNGFSRFIFDYQSDHLNMLRAHDFTSNAQSLFVSYTKYGPDNNFSHLISSFSYNCDDKNIIFEEKVLWESVLSEKTALNTQAAGGALLLDGDDLYSSFGYVNLTKWEDAVDYVNAKKAITGVSLKIDINTNSAEIFTSGHKNITAFWKKGMKIFSVEHAQKGGDEINLLKKGSNYGFPYKSFGTKYGSYKKVSVPGPQKNDNLLEDPIHAFVPSIAPGDAVFLSNSVFERWNNSVIVAGLKSRSIFIGKFRDDNIVYMEPIFIGERVRSIVYFSEKIYLLTDVGQIMTLEIDPLSLENDLGGSGIVALSPHLSKCTTCHSLEPTAGGAAPHLFGITDRKIASVDFEYSSGFEYLKGQVWNKELLMKYIKNPESLVKGSYMPAQNLSAVEVENIYQELKSIR